MIKKILKDANEIASLKRSCVMDVASWTMEDCLHTACKDKASVTGEGDNVLVKPYEGGLYVWPVSVSDDGKQWVSGWI